MPCMSYDDRPDFDASDWKNKTDKLARIACKALTALEEDGRADLLLLKDDEVRVWWAAHKEADRKERARVAELERQERVKAEALARLSDEEKELLGLQSKPSSKKKSDKFAIAKPRIVFGDDDDDRIEEHEVNGKKFYVRMTK